MHWIIIPFIELEMMSRVAEWVYWKKFRVVLKMCQG